MPKTYFQALKQARAFLAENNKDQESANYLLMHQMEWKLTDLLLHYQSEISNEDLSLFKARLDRVIQDEPLQYIVGNAEFFGYDFQVTEDTLIPRLETMELVQWILDDHDETTKLKVADIGTGTGAIAITLKLLRENWSVTATDISAGALEVAKQNAATHQQSLTFVQGDILEPLQAEQFDIYVSNPPYIAESERDVMDASVLKYEPNQALFAANDGLEFYQRLAKQLKDRKNYELYLEFGYRQKERLKEIFETELPQLKLEFRNDISGKPRMMHGVLGDE